MSITLDNASVNDACISLLLSSLSESSKLLCDGKLFHVRCASHILNLIVQDGLRTIDIVIHSVRRSVKKVRGSPSRRQKFEECIQQVGLENKKWVSLDVPTRWNSTYLMLESALEFKRAFSSLIMLDPSFNCVPTPDEWDKAKVVCKFLKHFYSATNIVSGTKYPTSNLYFHEMWKIKVLLDEEANSSHVFISSMALGMQEKFNKYWKDCNFILAIPLILDPRYKLMYFRYCFPKMYGDATEKHVTVIENVFRQLFADYLTKTQLKSRPSTSDHIPTNSNGASHDLDMVRGWDQFICQQNTQRSKS
ncbi:hypothetical protein Taro_013022 [Colocasia esculenta]|uniref:hAT-like transposase RNase-H fold domain-containing protein n=1 Tax=Colocasia esculenta TaxID=4460 RepID=A0A843UEI0_COLES|nr:hypothetical protein [Colocasia esculenta]